MRGCYYTNAAQLISPFNHKSRDNPRTYSSAFNIAMSSSARLVETTTHKIPQLFPDVVYQKLTPAPDHPLFNFQGFHPGQTVLRKGHLRSTGHRAFPQDVIFDRDMAITVRDGAKLYADLFRPVDSEEKPVPVIIPWSPYGKTGTGPQNYDFMAPFRAGIAKSATSGYEKFEVRNRNAVHSDVDK